MRVKKTDKRVNEADSFSHLIGYLQQVGPVSKEVVQHFKKNTYEVNIPKGKFLLKPGFVVSDLFFIVKGVIHGFIKSEGKQITTWINEENEFVSSIRTLGVAGRLCEEYLQALEDCQLIVIPIEFTEFIFNTYPETNVIGRRLWEHNYRGAEERAYICRITSAEKKYQRFIETQPNLINRISQKYIASYLGMTQETLSRVRNRKK